MPLSPAVIPELRRLLGPDGLVVTPEGRMTYECDMHTFYKGTPELVALPRTTAQVMELVRLCRRERVAVIPRGSGTGLIGGATAPEGGIMISTTRMNEILEIDLANRSATVQAGLINVWLSNAVRDRGYFFAPDPSSQMVSSIEGASEAVSAIIAAGIVPAALEMLDAAIIRAINEGIHAGYPTGAAAVLLIELDGPRAEVAAQAERVAAICRDHRPLAIRVATTEAERALLWKGRKEAA